MDLVWSDLPASWGCLGVCRQVVFGWPCWGGHPDGSQSSLGWHEGHTGMGTSPLSPLPTASRTGTAPGRSCLAPPGSPEVAGWPGDVI